MIPTRLDAVRRIPIRLVSAQQMIPTRLGAVRRIPNRLSSAQWMIPIRLGAVRRFQNRLVVARSMIPNRLAPDRGKNPSGLDVARLINPTRLGAAGLMIRCVDAVQSTRIPRDVR